VGSPKAKLAEFEALTVALESVRVDLMQKLPLWPERRRGPGFTRFRAESLKGVDTQWFRNQADYGVVNQRFVVFQGLFFQAWESEVIAKKQQRFFLNKGGAWCILVSEERMISLFV
jgi:hypothetical protein